MTPLTERVDEVFSPITGALARAGGGFEARAGQRALARDVASTIADGGVLLAEAGTGIGKTLAYLVPALLSGKRVLVSTGTRNLQDQIVYKDIPALASVLGRPITATDMKGRTNYLCLHRFGRLREASSALPDSDQRWLEEIAEWSVTSPKGDRAEIEDLPDDLALWFEITATGEQCLGRDCPSYADCFVTRMRQQAEESSLIIVNHHLLCADAAVRQSGFGEVIPECDILVIDEAHQLEDVATQYFGVALGTHRVEEFCRDAERTVSALPADAGRLAFAIAETTDELSRRSRLLFEAAREALARTASGDRASLTPAMALDLSEAREALTTALHRVIAIGGAEGVPPEVETLGQRAAAMLADLETLLTADDDRYVHFVERRGRSVTLRAAPIDASAIVRDTLIGQRHAAVLLSATLAVDGDFTYVQSRLGLEQARTVAVASEFDYRSQAVLYLPPDMPDPRSPEFNARVAEVVSEVLECSRGRAFVLFTSYAALREVHARLGEQLEWPLLVQGTAPRAALLRDFKVTPNAVLLATASFWHGVDVAGDALSAVIIDRLPFASPADPLVAARIQALEAKGQHPFHAYQVPFATLTLLQGLGRLIRTRTDRGVLAILDPRLTRMSYGRRFLSAMPPAPLTDDLSRVREFLASDPM